MLNALRLNALRRAVVCTAWACVWLAQARTVLRLLATAQAEQRPDEVWVRGAQLALIAAMVATFLACTWLAFTPQALPSMDDMRRVSSSGPSTEGLAPMTQRPAPGFLVCEALRLLLHISLSYHPAEPSSPGTCVLPNINILSLEVICTMRASFLGLDPMQHALSWAFTPAFWLLDYRYASLNALPGCATALGHALRRGLPLIAAKAFLTGLPVLLLSRDSKAHPCLAATVCLTLLGVQAFTSGWRVLNLRSTAVGLWEVWLAHMVAFGVGADEGNSIGEMHMQVRRAQRLVEDALPRHVVETLMHELHEPPAAMPSPGAWGSHPHSQSLELLSDYEHLVGQHHERHSHRLSQYQHISGQDAGAQPYHLHAQYLEGGAGHGHEHHGRQARGGHGEGHHGHYVHFSGGSSQHAGQEQHHSSHSHSQDSEGQQPQGQQQRQPCLPNVREDEPQGGGWFDTARPGPSHLSLTDLPSQEAAARKSPARSAVSTPGGLVVLGPSDAAQGAGWRGSGSGPSLPSLRSSGESSACTPYCPAGYGARLSLSGSSGPLAPVVPPRLSFGSTSSQSQGYGGAVNQDSDKADSTYAESHPAACVLFADIVSYTTISAATSPLAMVNLLNSLFRKFDLVVAEEPHLYKLDMIGDCYMVASGLHWHANDRYPARTLVDFAKFLLRTTATVLNPVTGQPLQMRVGVHKGPAVGALLGRLRRKYTLLGDTVNIASRMESTCPRPGAIHISAVVYEELLGCARERARDQQQGGQQGYQQEGQQQQQQEFQHGSWPLARPPRESGPTRPTGQHAAQHGERQGQQEQPVEHQYPQGQWQAASTQLQQERVRLHQHTHTHQRQAQRLEGATSCGASELDHSVTLQDLLQVHGTTHVPVIERSSVTLQDLPQVHGTNHVPVIERSSVMLQDLPQVPNAPQVASTEHSSVTFQELRQVYNPPHVPVTKTEDCFDAFHTPHTSSHAFPLSASQHLTADTLGAWTGSSGAAEPVFFSRDSFEGFGFGLGPQAGGRSRRASQVSQYSARLNLPPHGAAGGGGGGGLSSGSRGGCSLDNPSRGGSLASAHHSASQARGSRHSQNLDGVDVQDDVVTVWSPRSREGSGSTRLAFVSASLQGSFDAEAAETSSAEAAVSGANASTATTAYGGDADTPRAAAAVAAPGLQGDHRLQGWGEQGAHARVDQEGGEGLERAARMALPGLEAWQYRGETELKGRVATLETYVLQVV